MTEALLAGLLVIALGAAARLRPPARTVSGDDADRADNPHPPTMRLSASPRRQRVRPTDSDIARWCDDIARGTRAGLSLGGAIVHATPPPHADEVERLVLQLGRGAPVERAAADVADRHDRDEGHHRRPTTRHASSLSLAFTALEACARHGGPPSEPLGRAAAVLRGRAHDDAERRVHSAQARLSAIVMTVLPMAMLALLVATSASVRSILAGPSGLVLVTSGTVLNLVGWRWMRSIIDRRVA